MAQRKVSKSSPSGWTGWIFFAAAMMLTIGGMQIISGLVAIFKDDFYVATQAGLLAFNYTTWGWINMGLGLVTLLTGLGLLAGSTWARVIGVFLTVIVMLANAAFLSAYPLWFIISLIIGGCVVYALTMHGGELVD